MTIKNFASASVSFLIACAALCVFTVTGPAQKISLTLQDAPLTILKSSSTSRKVNGIPASPGTLEIRFKWHVMTFIPNTFNKLKVELMHGSRVLKSDTCYSNHAVPTPRCLFFVTVDQTEAAASGDWKLRITNNTEHDVNGFNIRKESTDLNPLVQNIVSTFQPDCSIRDLLMAEFDVSTGSTVRRIISGIPNMAGEIRIRAKWHTEVLTPNIFNPLTVRLLRDGQIADSQYGYSIHSGNKNKIDLRFTVSPLASGSSRWEIEVNNTYLRIVKFGIEKGTDSNPFVPQFKSTFVPACN